ncbi:MAG: hypothetical protein FI687_03445 [SAR202 cluster bacterium]|nr:hypothetical protein [SAR202 cluster bacterium]|tara:strand:- start:53592 stop:54086 length:495 start_codon:yes stop_codon:yes gene_type:complete
MSNIELNQSIYAFLEQFKGKYELIKIEPDFADTVDFCDQYGFPLENSGNTIIVASKKISPVKFCACLVKASTRLDVNGKVKELMNVSRLSFATPEQTTELTGMMVGGVTPLGLPNSIKVFVDQLVMDLEYVIIGGGNRTYKIKIDPDVFNGFSNFEIVDGLSKN